VIVFCLGIEAVCHVLSVAYQRMEKAFFFIVWVHCRIIATRTEALGMFMNSYYEKGEGECLIMLHGNGEDGTIFSIQADFLSRHFRVVVPDTRGHGKSERGDGEFTIRRFADDLKFLMDNLGIAKADILGFSDGANIAMCFAAKYPEMVDKLILVGGNLVPSGLENPERVSIEISYRLNRLLSPFSKRAKRKAEMLSLVARQPDLTIEELGRISAKTLVIAGTSDVIKKEHTVLISKLIKGAELIFISGSHWVFKDNAEDFDDAVLPFLLG